MGCALWGLEQVGSLVRGGLQPGAGKVVGSRERGPEGVRKGSLVTFVFGLPQQAAGQEAGDTG